MPHFFRSGDFYGVSYITGPAHVCLQVVYTAEAVSELPRMIELQPRGGCCHGPLDPDLIRSAVMEGTAAANNELGTTPLPVLIGYIPNDSPRYALFGHCAALLVRRLANSVPFESRPSA